MRTEVKCPVCKRLVSVDGTRIATHGPGKRGDFMCAGSNRTMERNSIR